MDQRIKNINTVIIILSVILISALISGSILYWLHLKTKDAQIDIIKESYARY